MKLIWAIVQDEDARALVDALTQKEYRLTRINTAGGFLRRGNATIILGVEDQQVDDVLSVIEQNCQRRMKTVLPSYGGFSPADSFVAEPIEVEVGGAIVFILDLANFRRL